MLLAAGAAAVGGAGYYFMSSGAAQKAEAKVAGPAKKAFTGGDQGFVSLVLDEVEDINHNTKKFRFKLPEDDMVSGMQVTSAILTKFKAPDAEKAVIRPYTPTSDEGE
jgi:cytochrome-b5 reductase